jgi:hypothetical protein
MTLKDIRDAVQKYDKAIVEYVDRSWKSSYSNIGRPGAELARGVCLYHLAIMRISARGEAELSDVLSSQIGLTITPELSKSIQERVAVAKQVMKKYAPEERLAAAADAQPAREDARLAAIKAEVYMQSNFLGSCLDHLSGWRFGNGEVVFLFAQKDSFFADLLKSREQQETLRSVCAQVLGHPVNICVRLSESP